MVVVMPTLAKGEKRQQETVTAVITDIVALAAHLMRE